MFTCFFMYNSSEEEESSSDFDILDEPTKMISITDIERKRFEHPKNQETSSDDEHGDKPKLSGRKSTAPTRNSKKNRNNRKPEKPKTKNKNQVS